MTRTARTPFLAALACAAALVVALLPSSSPAASRLPSERQWHHDVRKVMRGSLAYVDSRVAGGHGKKLAINLDIDNSSVASHYRPGTAVPAVLRFATHAHRLGVALLFNTARHDETLKAARALLENAGYPVTAVCGRTSVKEPVAHGKQRCRAHFIKQGYHLIANVGNHVTDFSGPRNYGRAYKLPSYGRGLS